MIPPYSPQSAWAHGAQLCTWQERLPQESRSRGIRNLEPANEFLSCQYMAEFNQKFAVRRRRKGVPLCAPGARTSTGFFSVQHESTVNQDNTISVENRVLQLEKTR
jgi:hypothetical protein